MFNLIKIENGRMNVPEPEYFEVTANEEVIYGEALVLSSGKLTKCAATTKPTHIAMRDVAAASKERKCPVCRVESNQVYEVPVTAAPSSLVAGDKVTLHTDGLQVTATKTDGVATIISKNGATAIGDKLIVRF